MASATRQQVARVVEKAMNEHELRSFLAAETTTSPTGLRNKALLTLMATSGLRVSEALGLKARDLVRDGDDLSVRLMNTKAGVPDLVPVNAEAAGLLLRWLDHRKALGVNGNAPLFCTVSEGAATGFGDGATMAPGKPVSRQYVYALVKRLAAQAGIEGKRVSPHSLRHTCGTLVYLRTKDRLAARKLLRHASDAVTEGYIAAAQLDTRAAVEALPKVLAEEKPEPAPTPMEALVATLTTEQKALLRQALGGEQDE